MKKIDAFAHILTPNYYQRMLEIAPNIPKQYSFIKIPTLVDLNKRLELWPDQNVKQVLSFANINAEDYVDGEQAVKLCEDANSELAKVVADHPDKFVAGVGMLAMNNIAGSCGLLAKIAQNENLVGAQIFTRHLGKSIADPNFEPVLAKAAELNLPLWLHPVFDKRKPDNNLVFSWEYELSQAMLQLVQANIFEKYPNLKIIVHHAGAMAPFFAGRIDHILNEKQANDFKKFYVDTAILGNTSALKLAISYYGIDHILFGTDAPFGVMPAGATKEVVNAIAGLNLNDDLNKIYQVNYQKLVK
ncbi:amidohydrolase family protein [Lactobacillus ultunensis]|uniref:Amidohydrolase family protein n=1 Tax=Lactobacillus ultunensis DSM 16047 TaxID=525365 RepID=C2EN73_9LACO|nr:amidohydrolase family protein [Lactobacillus ultunensis]EEJ72009.1 amidohydrolase family protein [Lactobacillus ultunensis DSM 16047]KRL80465.1 aminocarboxymuconate-semialdehyde decarboxylase [Lactobacillus ultunensis DSM 16047]